MKNGVQKNGVIKVKASCLKGQLEEGESDWLLISFTHGFLIATGSG